MSVNKVSNTDGSLTPIAKNTSNSLSYLSDVDIISSSTGQILQYDGSKWGNGQPAYQINDTAETNLADDDKIPFYDTSASNKRSSTWSNIKAKLKTYFDTLYATISTVSGKQDKTLSAQVEGQSTVEGALGALSSNKVGWDVAGKSVKKNCIPLTLSKLKEINTAGTWLGNVYTRSGVTYTVYTNKSGYVTKIETCGTATGTATLLLLSDSYKTITDLGLELNKPYILSGCASGGASNTYNLRFDGDAGVSSYPIDTGNGVTFTFESSNDKYRPVIKVSSGSDMGTSQSPKEFYPMIRDARIADSTYEPFIYDNTELLSYADNGVLGAKNALSVTLEEVKDLNTYGTWSGNVYTLYGTSFTVYTDDYGYVNKVTATGAPTANAGLVLKRNFTLDNDYILNGIIGGSNSTYLISMLVSGSTYITDFDGDKLVPKGTYQTLTVSIRANYNPNGKEFYPMLRLATDTDPTFQPFAQTNRQLTVDKAEISAIGDNESGRTTASRAYSAGEYFYKDGQNCRTKTGVASGETWTLNTNYEVKSIDSALVYKAGDTFSSNSHYYAPGYTQVVSDVNTIFCAIDLDKENTATDITNITANSAQNVIVRGVSGIIYNGSLNNLNLEKSYPACTNKQVFLKITPKTGTSFSNFVEGTVCNVRLFQLSFSFS